MRSAIRQLAALILFVSCVARAQNTPDTYSPVVSYQHFDLPSNADLTLQYSQPLSYSYNTAVAPVITTISPNPVTGSNSVQTITITGSGFATGMTALVAWSKGSATMSDSSKIVADSPTQARIFITTQTDPDNWTIQLTNADGQSSNVFSFQVVAPSVTPPPVTPPPTTLAISGLSPDPVIGSYAVQTLTLGGTGFATGMTAIVSWSNGSATLNDPSKIVVDSSTQVRLFITTQTDPDNWTVQVTNPANGQSSNIFGFQVVAPSPVTPPPTTPSPTTPPPTTPPPATPNPTAVSISTDQRVYHISTAPAMPLVHASVVVPGQPNASVSWTATITFNPKDHDPQDGPARSDLGLVTTPVILPASQEFVPQFNAIRGGDLTIQASVLGNSQLSATTQGLTIIGNNPSLDEIASAAPAKYRGVLMLIAKHESYGGNQFTNSASTHSTTVGYPLWSQDGKGGVGLFQITDPAPTADQVWDWQANLAGAVSKLDSVAGIAKRYRKSVLTSPIYQALVDKYNQKRINQGLAPLTITLAPFTKGDFNGNYQQTEMMAVRAYNGAAGEDTVFKFHLQEFKLATKGTTKLKVMVDEGNLQGTAYWVRVPASERPSAAEGGGDPNYVEAVLGL